MTWTTTGGSVIFKPYSLEQALSGLAEAGFRNVELGAVSDFHKHLDPDALGPREIAQARAMLEHYGLTCVSVSGHAQLQTPVGMDRLGRVLSASSELGVQVLNTFTGEPESDEQRATLIANARRLADRAQELGVRLCIENDSTLMPSAEAGLALLDEIGREWIQINDDPANVIYFAGLPPEKDVDFALRRLGHVHLKDKRGGQGVADFRHSARVSSTSRDSSRGSGRLTLPGRCRWRSSFETGSGRPGTSVCCGGHSRPRALGSRDADARSRHGAVEAAAISQLNTRQSV